MIDGPLIEKRLANGIVKFPPNVYGIYIEKQASGHTHLIARQNDTRLTFILSEDDCLHLAALLSEAPSLSEDQSLTNGKAD